MPKPTTRSNISAASRCHLAAAFFLCALFVFLAAQTAKPDHWSAWDWGDAQTLLTLTHWQKQGWLHNYLLFKPQGYAPMVDLLDEEGLRQHAHGISPSPGHRVAPRLWYTHYPAGYLLPYALLTRLGLGSRQSLQLFSITVSLAGLLFMYLAFSRISTPVVALAAVIFYGTSLRFTSYADSLANQPMDDMLRFAFMLAVVLSTRADRHRRRWLALAWSLEFCLSLTSFDSVFFLYAWLIGWDILEGKGLRWRKWLLFALAPVTAHGLQLLQNAWYLGWNNALLDIQDTYLSRHTLSNVSGLSGHLQSFWPALRSNFHYLDLTGFGLPLLLFLYIMCRHGIAGSPASLPTAPLLLLLFACGALFAAVLPGAAMMSYEGRQMIPFVAMLAGGTAGAFLHGLRQWHGNTMAGPGDSPSRSTPNQALHFGATAAAFVLLVILAVYTHLQTPPNPVKVRMASGVSTEHLFAQELQDLPTAYDPVYFVAGRALTIKPDYMPGYPQIHPFTEYYAGSRLFLCFNTPDLLARDLATLLDRSGMRFSPVLIAASPEEIEETLAILRASGRITARPPEMLTNRERFLLDLTPYITWPPPSAASP